MGLFSGFFFNFELSALVISRPPGGHLIKAVMLKNFDDYYYTCNKEIKFQSAVTKSLLTIETGVHVFNVGKLRKLVSETLNTKNK